MSGPAKTAPGGLRRAWYRVWQFIQAVTARPLAATDRQEIAALLNDEEQRLFRRMSRADQWHSYQVLVTLRRTGHNQPALLKAALLHDIGKSSVRAAWWDRPVVVLGQAFLPARATRWAQGPARGWRRPFVVKAQHAAWGAAAAAQAGSDPLTVDLIRHHQDTIPVAQGLNAEVARLLAQLQWADDQN